MGLIVNLFLSALVGFMSHVFWLPTRKFENKRGARLGNKLREAIGILTFIPVMACVWGALKMSAGKIRVVVAGLLTALSYGGGNFLAHILDKD